MAGRITNAGAIFIGPHTPVAVGDYWAEPQPHAADREPGQVLQRPDQQRLRQVDQSDRVQRQQLAAAADDIVRLADTEGLTAHARSVAIRRQRQE